MGEIADAMITGDYLCGTCGVYLSWADAPGFPCYCSRECAPDKEAWKCSEAVRCEPKGA